MTLKFETTIKPNDNIELYKKQIESMQEHINELNRKINSLENQCIFLKRNLKIKIDSFNFKKDTMDVLWKLVLKGEEIRNL